MRNKEGIASVIDEELFEQKLQRLAKLNPSAKKKRLSSINSGESVRFLDHMIVNQDIENSRAFKAEWEKENPDGEYQD